MSNLFLYNSKTRKKEKFVPLQDKKVLMYVCGITPYDTTHLGHAFTYVSFDALIRYLHYKGYNVNYVQNVTDIDDDILKRAKRVNKNWKKLGDFWTGRFLNDLKALNVLPPTHYVKATSAIEKIIEMTIYLLDKRFAYEVQGNIYFSVKKFPKYGELSHFTYAQMLRLARERGGRANDPNIKDPLDFLLWQKSGPDEPSWESPWGKGRPGWHIECSALVNQYLCPQIDIHGGGRDLIFPHHESEIAQSESYTHKASYVKYWLHTAMLIYQGEKMSKSLGNLVMVADLLKKYSANAVRWVLLSHHYRTPWEYFDEEIEEAEKTIDLIDSRRRFFRSGGPARSLRSLRTSQGREKQASSNFYLKQFESLIDDDLNTPEALKLVKELAENNQEASLKKIMEVLGFT